MIDNEEVVKVIDDGERLYAPVEVARILDLKTATVQNMCRDGRIAANKMGTMWRVTKREVARYIKEGPRQGKDTVSNV